MASKHRSSRRHSVHRTPPARKAASGLAITWEGTREALGSAEAAVERRVRALVKRGGSRTQQAAETLNEWGVRLERERRRTMKQVEEQLAVLQTRMRRERKAVARMADDAVRGALAALNIPSRQEVHELTRRVEELSRKIDGFRRTAPRRAMPRRSATTVRVEAAPAQA